MLEERGVRGAYLYGADAEEQPGTGGLNAFFLLVDRPEVYNLPPDPVAPATRLRSAWLQAGAAALSLAALALHAAGRGSGR